MEAPPPPAPEVGEREGEREREALDSPAQLATLRKKVLKSLLEQLHLVEIAGGMRAICFMKVQVGGGWCCGTLYAFLFLLL